jgi:fucose permease
MSRALRLEAIAFLAFVSLGLPDGVLGVAWPSMRGALGLGMGELGSLLAAAMVGYVVSAFASGALTARLGLGGLLLASSVVMAASSMGYAMATGRVAAVTAALLAGLGGGAIDAGINAYTARRLSARLATWLHACYGVGAALGPLLVTGLTTRGVSWRVGYVTLAAALSAMTVAFARTRSVWDVPAPDESSPGPPRTVRLRDALASRAVWLNSSLFFVYTGLEVVAGQWIFSVFTEGRGVSAGAAGVAVSAYWASLTVGRVAFGVLAARHAPIRLLRVALVGASSAALTLWWAPQPLVGFAGLAALGFTFAPIYPLMVTMTPERVGPRLVTQALGVQVAVAYLGTAALPAAAGALASSIGLQAVPPFLFAGTVVFAVLCHLPVGAGRNGFARVDAMAAGIPRRP